DFLKLCRIYFREKDIASSADKLLEVADRFSDGSPADEWFKNLPAIDKATWDLFSTAFETRFKDVKPVLRLRAQLLAELSHMRIGMGEIAGQAIETHRRTVSPLNHFAYRVQSRANEAKAGTEETGLWDFFEGLPTPIWAAIGTIPTSWNAMVAELEAVPETKVKAACDAYLHNKMMSNKIELLAKQVQSARLSGGGAVVAA
ncbi:hypothetical protein C8F01DRAFT_952516, partial [Mycena amicta]